MTKSSKTMKNSPKFMQFNLQEHQNISISQMLLHIFEKKPKD